MFCEVVYVSQRDIGIHLQGDQPLLLTQGEVTGKAFHQGRDIPLTCVPKLQGWHQDPEAPELHRW